MDNKDFDPSKIEKVSIDSVKPNDYNPKLKGSEEYQKVVESLRTNGLKTPIFVRETEDGLVIVDGEQRWTAANELGYKEIYVYNLGDISEEEAKALTIWFEVQVPFDELMLAPIVVELSQMNYDLPYTEEQIVDFKHMSDFDFSDPNKEEEEEMVDDQSILKVMMTLEQMVFIKGCIKTVKDKIKCSEGEALFKLCGGESNEQ